MTSAVPGLATPTATGNQAQKLATSDKILDSLMARITTPDEIKHLKVLVYCRPGVGKTWFGASAPTSCIYDIDETTVSLQKNPNYAKLPIIPFVSEYQAEMLLSKIAEGALWGDRETFVFDSATVFQTKSFKTQIRTQLGIRDESQVGNMLTRYLNSDMNWPANTQYLEDICTKIGEIKDKHVIITAHVKTEKDTTSGIDRMLIRPDITNKAYQSFARWANVIGYMDVNGDKRTLRIKPSATIDAKSHIGGPDVIDNPTFQSLLDILNKEKVA